MQTSSVDTAHETSQTRARLPDAQIDSSLALEVPGRSRWLCNSELSQLVFLVPGLLGFESFSSFGYFGDKVGAALRASLQPRVGQRTPVMALPILPTASLVDRQRQLVTTMLDRVAALGCIDSLRAVHLLGHSTGGVDANLLTAPTALGDQPWETLDARAPELLAKIRSVVTLASPHQGACVTAEPIARLVGAGDLRGVPDLLRLAARLGSSSAGDSDVLGLLGGVAGDAVATLQFVRQVTRPWPLIGDLKPTRSSDMPGFRADVLRRSVAVLAGQPRPGSHSAPADPFFEALHARASGARTGTSDDGRLVAASVARLQQALGTGPGSVEVIVNARSEPRGPVDASSNDGVVNAARQLMNPHDTAELLAVVVGDHFDVLGRYDRVVWKRGRRGRLRPTQVPAGILHSGSRFRDDEFFRLYDRVAAVMASAAT